MFKSKVHCDPMQGLPADSQEYCKKEGKFKSAGKFTCQGYRTDLEEVKRQLDKGTPMVTITKENFGSFLQYGRSWQRYRALIQQEDTRGFRRVQVIVHSGTTGTGKTRTAMESEEGIYKISGCQLRWWDGYEGEKTILIDEYANQVAITELLPLLDGYQYRLEIKGGFTYAAWTKVYITTNLEKLHINAALEHKEALKRRITTWVNFRKPL